MRSATLPSPNWRIYFPKRQRIAKTMGYSRETGIGEIISRGLPTAATTPNIAQRCSYAHTKFAQQIQFTVGHLADFDSAYFSESESVKLVYITDIARFTRLETRLNSSAICRQHRCRGRCRLETTTYCLPIPVSRL